MIVELNSNWVKIKLDEAIAFAIGGDWGKSEDFESPDFEKVYCIRGSEFREWQKDKAKTSSPRKLKKASIEKRTLVEGDVLVEISGGGPEQPVGRTVLIDKGVLANFPNTPVVHTNFLRLIRLNKELNPKWINTYLEFFYDSGEVVKYQAGSNNLRNLKFGDYIGIEVPLPPLPEQRSIVAKIEQLFSELDNGIANLKKAQEQLKVFRQAVLKKAFEGELTKTWREQQTNLPTADELLAQIKEEREKHYQIQLEEWKATVKEWEKSGKKDKRPTKPRQMKELPELTEEQLSNQYDIPNSAAWVQLGDVVWSVKDGPHYSPKYSESGIPFISGGNIRPSGVDFKNVKYISEELHKELSKRCKPELNDVLYTKGGTTGIARVNTYDIDYNVWVHVAVLKPVDSIFPFYLQHVLNSSHCYRQSQKYTHGVGNQDLGLTRMVLITLPLYSKEEQHQIVQEIESRLSVCDKVEESIEDNLQKAEALRQSILKKAFEGQLLTEAELETCRQQPDWEPAEKLLARIERSRKLSGRNEGIKESKN